MQDARPGSVQVHAGHDSIEDLADPTREQARGGRFSRQPLHLLRVVLLLGAVDRERAELVRAVGRPLAAKRGVEEPLRDTHSLDVKRYGSVYCQFVIVRRAFSFIPVTIEESK
jgi:hypothetical protein